uniref:Uncharacterized protein n=1 Tax=Pycnococcus provasolii TaxID=41880 RepID=A0A7S2B5X9_9CHLO|mmetsp:Transcript_6144/g.13998  ORF Transcript_6144/g.13998 Transcript_6144/m.13998 type:complete len:142 (+) Transcript_6144:28-453(+)
MMMYFTRMLATATAVVAFAQNAHAAEYSGKGGYGYYEVPKTYYGGASIPIGWNAYKQNTYYTKVVPPIYVRRIPNPTMPEPELTKHEYENAVAIKDWYNYPNKDYGPDFYLHDDHFVGKHFKDYIEDPLVEKDIYKKLGKN